MERKLFNELLWMAFEFFLATRGAEVVCLAFQINPEFCCFFVRHSAAHRVSHQDHRISQGITLHVLMKYNI